VPDFSTLSRRQKTLKVNIPYRGSDGPLHLLVDSTGIKVEGEGEWNARKHGGSKRRVWRKIHIGIDEKSLEIRAAEFTASDIGDAPMLLESLGQIPPEQEIATVTADGAFDTRKCHNAIAARGAAAIIQPRKNAKPWKPDTAGAVARNEALRASKLRPDHLATMERLPPPKPRRNQDALRQAAGTATVRAGLRPSGRRVPGACGRLERLHRPRHTHHRGHGISLSGERKTLALSRFVEQSPLLLDEVPLKRCHDHLAVINRQADATVDQVVKVLLDFELEPATWRDFVRALNTDFPAHPASPLPRLTASRARFGQQCTPGS
jgi:hypothetical protein